MAVTALYILSTGEVVKISQAGQPFADRDATYWGVLTDPVLTDGSDVRNPADLHAPLRELGFAKIWTGSEVRNATQGEIDSWAGSRATIESLQMRDDVKALVDGLGSNPKLRKLFVALVDIMKDEINILRALHSLPDRTLSQVKTAIRDRISEND